MANSQIITDFKPIKEQSIIMDFKPIRLAEEGIITDFKPISEYKPSFFQQVKETVSTFAGDVAEGYRQIPSKAREIIFKEPHMPESVGEFVTKNVPESALRLAYGLPAFFYETAKGIVEPPFKQRSVFATPQEIETQISEEQKETVKKAIIGIIDFIGTYTGAKDIAHLIVGGDKEKWKYLSPTTFKEAWLTEPAAGLLAISPFLRTISKKAKATGKTPENVVTEMKEDIMKGKPAEKVIKEIQTEAEAQPPKERFVLEPIKPTEAKVKPTQPDMLGVTEGAMEGKMPTTELPETALELATREVEAGMAGRQIGMPIEVRRIPETIVYKGEKWSTGSLVATQLTKNPDTPLIVNVPDKILRDANSVLSSTIMKMSDLDPRMARVEKAYKAVENELKQRMAEGQVGIPEGKERPLKPPTLSEVQGEEGFIRVKGEKPQPIDLREKVPEKDVLAGRDWWTSPEFEFRKNPISSKIVSDTIEAGERATFYSENETTLFNEIKTHLSKAEQIQIRQVLEKKITGSPKVQKAAQSVREYLDAMREQVKDYKRVMYEKYLSKNENQAVGAVLKGEDIKVAAEKFKVEPEIITDLINEYRAIDKWGIDDYVPNIERGNYRFVDEKGATRLIGVTKKDAIRKAEQFLKDNPDVKTLWLDTEFASGVEFPTKLTKGQYFRLKHRLMDEYAEDARTIQKILHERGSIVAIRPTQKYAAPMLHRRGILKGEENVFDVLPAYSYIMNKKMQLDPVLADARTEAWKLPPNMKEQVLTYIDDVKGRKTISDKIVDELFEKAGLGAKSFAVSRAVGTLKTGSAWLKLGYRPINATINLAGGQGHVWTKLGVKYYTKGQKFLFTKEGRTYLQEEAPYLGLSFAQEAGLIKSKVPLWHPLGLFQKPEPYNRKIAIAGNYLFAKEKLGMSEGAAREFARRSNRFQNFTYDIASLPRIMRGPMGRLILQFKPYLVKELEFVSTLRGAEIPRYITMQLTLGGPRALIILLKSLPVLGVLGLLDNAEEWLNKNLPRTSRGIAGLLGADVSPAATFQFPTTPEEWAGPVVGDILKLYKQIYVPIAEGEGYIEPLAQDYITGLSPAFYHWDNLIDSIMDNEGWVKNKQGQRLFQATNWDRLRMAMGATPLKHSLERVAEREILREEKVERKTRSRIVDEISKRLLAGKGISDELLEDALDYGAIRITDKGQIDYTSIEKDLMWRHLTPRQRLYLKVRKENRRKLMENYPEE